jgi:uncharacterized OB-fold protein
MSKPRCTVECSEEIRQYDNTIARLTLELARARREGWKCPNCGKAHGPQMQTCPAPPHDNRAFGERIRSVENG